MNPTGATILQVPAYVLALAFAVSVVVSGLKDGIESVLPPSNHWHDLFFTLLPVVLCVAAVLGYTLTLPGRHSAQDVFLSLVWGTLAGFGAIGGYVLHTRTGSAEATTVPQTPPAPFVHMHNGEGDAEETTGAGG